MHDQQSDQTESELNQERKREDIYLLLASQFKPKHGNNHEHMEHKLSGLGFIEYNPNTNMKNHYFVPLKFCHH